MNFNVTYIHKFLYRSFCDGNSHVCITKKRIRSSSGIIFEGFIKMLYFSSLFLQMACMHV
jgi:hypothetical protein